jgi:hypothetical protein
VIEHEHTISGRPAKVVPELVVGFCALTSRARDRVVLVRFARGTGMIDPWPGGAGRNDAERSIIGRALDYLEARAEAARSGAQ